MLIYLENWSGARITLVELLWSSSHQFISQNPPSKSKTKIKSTVVSQEWEGKKLESLKIKNKTPRKY